MTLSRRVVAIEGFFPYSVGTMHSSSISHDPATQQTQDQARDAWVESVFATLSPAQKIGQLMVFAHYGSFITPDVRHMITRHHVGGFRISQKFHPGSAEHRAALRTIAFGVDEQVGTGEKLPPSSEFLARSTYGPDADCYDRGALPAISCTGAEFAEALNELRSLSLASGNPAGLHYAFDHEGEFGDFCFQSTRNYPNPLGIFASGDPKLAYEVGLAIGRQARALGANFIHSPVLDVACNPANPEVGTRAFGPSADAVTEFGMQSYRGLRDAGLIPAAKHFPGRGDSVSDAHYGLPLVTASRQQMHDIHLAPYRALIADGLPAIMAAFSAYPSLEAGGATDIPAATSPRIINGLLRGEMGFEGVITTDNCQMGGLLERYEIGEAAVRCLVAGCDLVLFRAYTPARLRVLRAVEEALNDGTYREEDLNRSVRRILRMRYSMGLQNDGGKVDTVAAGVAFNDPVAVDTARRAAEETVTLLRDRKSLLPIARDKKVLLLEQAHALHLFQNSNYCHPGVLWKELCKLSDSVGVVLMREQPSEEDMASARKRLAEADVVVATNYYNYRGGTPMEGFIREIVESGKPVIVVTNNPFASFGAPSWADTVVVNFGISSGEGNEVTARVLMGAAKAKGKIDFDLGETKEQG